MEGKEEKIGYKLVDGLRSILPLAKGESHNSDFNLATLKDPFIARLLKSSPSAIAIFNHETSLYEYFSPNMEELLGWPIANLQGISGQQFSFDLFHPDHLKIILKQIELVKIYYEEYALKKRLLDCRYTFSLKIKRGNGNYIWTMMQTVVLEVTPEGLPYRSMIMVSDITGVKNNSKVDFVFSVKNEKDGCHESINISHHEASKDYRLSDREIEILNCVSKGMRNHEIADKLNISKHTVITHRRNIMKKSGKESIIQLLME